MSQGHSGRQTDLKTSHDYVTFSSHLRTMNGVFSEHSTSEFPVQETPAVLNPGVEVLFREDRCHSLKTVLQSMSCCLTASTELTICSKNSAENTTYGTQSEEWHQNSLQVRGFEIRLVPECQIRNFISHFQFVVLESFDESPCFGFQT